MPPTPGVGAAAPAGSAAWNSKPQAAAHMCPADAEGLPGTRSSLAAVRLAEPGRSSSYPVGGGVPDSCSRRRPVAAGAPIAAAVQALPPKSPWPRWWRRRRLRRLLIITVHVRDTSGKGSHPANNAWI